MYTVESFITSVQDANHKAINTFVTNEAVRKQLLGLVDAQTEFTLDAAERATEMFETFKTSATEAVSTAQAYFKKLGK